MDGWKGGRVEGKAWLRIAYSNQKSTKKNVSGANLSDLKSGPMQIAEANIYYNDVTVTSQAVCVFYPIFLALLFSATNPNYPRSHAFV